MPVQILHGERDNGGLFPDFAVIVQLPLGYSFVVLMRGYQAVKSPVDRSQ